MINPGTFAIKADQLAIGRPTVDPTPVKVKKEQQLTQVPLLGFLKTYYDFFCLNFNVFFILRSIDLLIFEIHSYSCHSILHISFLFSSHLSLIFSKRLGLISFSDTPLFINQKNSLLSAKRNISLMFFVYEFFPRQVVLIFLLYKR